MRLDTRVEFFSPSEGGRTETGGAKRGWNAEFPAWVAVRHLRGGEAVMGARMQGRRPAILILRKRSVLDAIRLDWIVKFGGQSYQLRELPKRREDGATVEMLVEAKI
ncbi:MAG: phage head completion protein [Mangrovicoccus sp.]